MERHAVLPDQAFRQTEIVRLFCPLRPTQQLWLTALSVVHKAGPRNCLTAQPVSDTLTQSGTRIKRGGCRGCLTMWLPRDCSIGNEPRCLMALTIAVWSLLGFVLFAVVSLVFPPGWRQIVWGSLIVIAGSAGSQLLPEWKKRKWLRWARAVCIGIVVAVGALVTTYGWNLRDNYLRDRTVLIAMATEWKLNDLHNTEIEWNEKWIRDRDYRKHQLFPLPTHLQITRAIDITKLVSLPAEQLPLGVVLVDYVNRMDFLCVRLCAINRFMGADLEAYAECVKQTFGEGDAYPEYLEAHRRVEARLRKAYPGLLEEVDWIRRKVERREESSDSKGPKSAEPRQSIDANSRAG